MLTTRAWIAVGVIGLSAMAGCEGGVPKKALALSADSLANRQLQTRRFETADELFLLSSAAGLLQDLGFNIDATESRLGLLVASKERDATDGGQIAGAIAVALLLGVSTPVDSNQRIRASVVTHPVGGQVALRVTFQRVVWNTHGQISRLELVNDPKIYQQFFEKLSKAVFLEAHSI